MRRRGFTLIECIIATFVLAIGFVAVASLYPMTFRGASVNANHVAAMQVASGVLAHIRSSPYGAPVDPQWLQTQQVTMVIEGMKADVQFTKTVTFARGGTKAAANANADVAKVKVEWDEGTGPSSEGRHKTVEIVGGVCREP